VFFFKSYFSIFSFFSREQATLKLALSVRPASADRRRSQLAEFKPKRDLTSIYAPAQRSRLLAGTACLKWLRFGQNQR